MKTHLAVYEESLFDLRGGGQKPFFRECKCPVSPPPPHPPPKKETLNLIPLRLYSLKRHKLNNLRERLHGDWASLECKIMPIHALTLPQYSQLTSTDNTLSVVSVVM